MIDRSTSIFEENRSLLEGLAYRMLGTLADAQDIVQDTYIQWLNTNLQEIQNERAWLITVCSRLSLNQLQAAKVKREAYFGVWLPDPLVTKSEEGDASVLIELDESVSVALMLALEQLTPTERAVYILYEVFNYKFTDIAQFIGKNSDNCRKLATRARARIIERKPRFKPSIEEHHSLLHGFFSAVREGRMDELKNLLSESIELHSDGGGRVQAAEHVLCGADLVASFFADIWADYASKGIEINILAQQYNGAPGALIFENKSITTAISMDVEEGKIKRIYGLRNPDKLSAFAALQ